MDPLPDELPDAHLLGEGWGGQAFREGGRLVYGIPVELGIVSTAFEFAIDDSDLDVLRRDPYRRSALNHVLHSTIQETIAHGPRKFTDEEFREVVDRLLHTDDDDLEYAIDEADVRFHTVHRHYIDQDLQAQP